MVKIRVLEDISPESIAALKEQQQLIRERKEELKAMGATSLEGVVVVNGRPESIGEDD